MSTGGFSGQQYARYTESILPYVLEILRQGRPGGVNALILSYEIDASQEEIEDAIANLSAQLPGQVVAVDKELDPVDKTLLPINAIPIGPIAHYEFRETYPATLALPVEVALESF